MIGRSGDSPASEGASSGFAVNSERTSSGRLVIDQRCSGSGVRSAKTSPSRRLAPEDELDLALVEAQQLLQRMDLDERRAAERVRLAPA